MSVSVCVGRRRGEGERPKTDRDGLSRAVDANLLSSHGNVMH